MHEGARLPTHPTPSQNCCPKGVPCFLCDNGGRKRREGGRRKAEARCVVLVLEQARLKRLDREPGRVDVHFGNHDDDDEYPRGYWVKRI